MSVNNRHRAFARAVVALAREHRMDGLVMTFRESFLGRTRPADLSREEVAVSWSEGRHGASSRIHLRTTAIDNIDEATPPSKDQTEEEGR